MERPRTEPVGLHAAGTFGFAVAYVVMALVGRSTVLPGAEVSLVWPAAGVAVLWLLAERPRRAGLVLLLLAVATAAVLAATGAPAQLTAAAVVAVVVQTWLVVVLLRRWCPHLLGAGGDRSVHDLRTLGLGILIVLLACCAGAFVTLAGLRLAGDSPDATTALLVWGRQVVGVLAVGSVGHLGWEWLSTPRTTRVGGGGPTELAALWAVSALAVTTVFTSSLPLLFLVVPLSKWSAARFSTFVGVVHATVVGSAALALTMAGVGPVSEVADPYVAAMVTQLFLLVLLLTSLAVGTLRDTIDGLVEGLASAREHAAAQAELLSRMTESMGEALVVLDAARRVVDHNSAGASLALKVRPGEVPEALAALVQAVDSADGAGDLRAELGPGDVVVPLSDGGEVVLAVTSRPLEGGRSTPDEHGSLLVMRDVTAHRAGLLPLVDFATTTAHDLRSPLTAMRTWVSLLAEDPDVRGKEHLTGPLERVDVAAVRMSGLIDDLLAHATAEGGEIAPEWLELRADRGVLADALALAGAREATVVAPGIPPVLVDPGAVTQLFANLLANAMKFTVPGDAPRVEITGWSREDRVVVEVRDHGIGVPDEDRTRIFERYRRSGAVRGSYVGTGLGLALCRAVVERHGGRIDCRAPDTGAGTIFRFDLPAALAAGPRRTQVSPRTDAPPPPPR